MYARLPKRKKKKKKKEKRSKWWSWKSHEFSPTSDSLAFWCFVFARQCCQIFRSDEKRSGRGGLLLPSLYFSLFLSSLSREKLAHDAKFRDFIDRKVSPVFRPFFVEFSKKIALPVKPHGHGLCRREIRSIHLVRELPAKEGCKTSKIYF